MRCQAEWRVISLKVSAASQEHVVPILHRGQRRERHADLRDDIGDDELLAAGCPGMGLAAGRCSSSIQHRAQREVRSIMKQDATIDFVGLRAECV